MKITSSLVRRMAIGIVGLLTRVVEMVLLIALWFALVAGAAFAVGALAGVVVGAYVLVRGWLG